ncbi:MAG: hypothetical protein Q7U75_15440, partial [Desulfobacterales bacterium]|nr:hypothetical protein [Desulfobacterales bacterium]
MKLLPTLVAGGLAAAAVASPLVPVSFQMPGLPASVTGYGASGCGEWAGEPLDLGSRHVLFLSTSANLVASDGNGAVLDLFRRDRKAGRTGLVSLTSSGRSGTRPVLAFSSAQSGDRVAFSWQSNDRAAGDTNGVEDVYVRDITAGTTRLVSARADGSGAGNAASGSPAMASGGRYVAFQSEATDLVGAAEEDGNRAADILLRDLETGTTELISATPAGVPGDRASRLPIINHDGSVIVFQSDALTLAPVEGYGTDLMVWSRASRSVTRVTIPGQTPRPPVRPLSTEQPVLSDDGRYLAFFIAVTGSSPVPAPYSGVWWFDLTTGERLRASGTTAVSLSDGEPSMSSDGRTLAFTVRSRPAVDA